MGQTISYKTLKFHRRFGIELELSNSSCKASVVKAIKDYSNHKVHSFTYGKSLDNKKWHVKTDITCGDTEDEQGWEVASFVGHTPQDVLHIGEVATALKVAGAKVNKYCGFHIHAEANDFDPVRVGILLAYWLKCEPVIKNIIASYRKFYHCKPLSDVMTKRVGPRFRWLSYDPLVLYNYFLPYREDDKKTLDPFDFRYRAVNIINYYLALNDRRRKRKTIELRFPEGTLETEDIIGWTRLYLNFIEFAKDAPMPENLHVEDVSTTMAYLGLGHDNDNFYVFGPSLSKTRIWFLKKLIKSSRKSVFKTEAKKLLKKINHATPI